MVIFISLSSPCLAGERVGRRGALPVYAGLWLFFRLSRVYKKSFFFAKRDFSEPFTFFPEQLKQLHDENTGYQRGDPLL